jgi:hypothetical protein
VVLAGCSGGGHKGGHAGLPTPAAGKVAAFDLGTLSDTYDLNEVVTAGDMLVSSDGSGDVYMLDWNSGYHPDVIRMTPQGVVSRYVQVNHRVDSDSMVVRADGSVVFGVSKDDSGTKIATLPVTDKDGSDSTVAIPPTSSDALPIGERPDGSLIVAEGGDLWSLKAGRFTRLYHQAEEIFTGAVVDPAGTVYVVPGANLSDIVAIPVGKAPEHLHVSGTVSGTGTAIASLVLSQLAPAGAGGFYALTQDSSYSSSAVVYIRGDHATEMAENPNDGHDCTAGKQYPALSNTCGSRAYIGQTGKRLLLFGSLVSRKPADPALALNAAGK